MDKTPLNKSYIYPKKLLVSSAHVDFGPCELLSVWVLFVARFPCGFLFVWDLSVWDFVPVSDFIRVCCCLGDNDNFRQNLLLQTKKGNFFRIIDCTVNDQMCTGQIVTSKNPAGQMSTQTKSDNEKAHKDKIPHK